MIIIAFAVPAVAPKLVFSSKYICDVLSIIFNVLFAGTLTLPTKGKFVPPLLAALFQLTVILAALVV